MIDGATGVDYVRNERNLGFVGTCNRAATELDRTDNDILLLNSDAELFPGTLQEMSAVLHLSEKHGVVTARSNHATIAGSLATAIVVLAPVWWRLAVPLALAVGATRVLTGAHYWHDVVAGLAIGVLVVWFGTWALAPTAHRLLQRSVASGSPRWRRAVGQGYEPRYAATDLPDERADGETAEPS